MEPQSAIGAAGSAKANDARLATIPDHLGADLDQLLPQSGQRPVFHFLRQGESLVWVTSRLHGHCVDTSALRAEADVIGGKADVEIERLLSARERTFSRQAQKVRL